MSSETTSIFASHYIPHGHCYLWQTPLVGLHVVSDLLIAIAYFSIPIALLYFVVKRKQDFPVKLLVLFGSFIVLCGVGHLFDIVTLWYPLYWISGAIRAATALVSCYTAVEVAILLPHFLSLKSAEELEKLNQQLQTKIAEKMETEKALESSKKVFESTFNYAPGGVVLVSTDGLFLRVNESYSRITGYSEEELIGFEFKSITHPDDFQKDIDIVEKLLGTEERIVLEWEKRYFHKEGHIVDVQLNVSLLRDLKNNPLFFIAHVQNISEQKRINASLEKAMKSATAANQAKSEFLAMMSHEIRTPMNAMLGMTEMLSETNLDLKQSEFVEVIRTSGNTLLTVINDILDFSKIESNKLELEMTKLNLYDCIEGVQMLYANQAEKKGLSFTSLIQPAEIPDFFRGDSVRLRQILSNLVSNSIKFTAEGEVSIHVQVEQQPSMPDTEAEADDSLFRKYTLSFAIKDTGIGIPPGKIKNLFKPFSQVDASTTRRFGGTGLGLAICKKLVEMMGGEIWIESEINQGSTFHFSIQLMGAKQVNDSTNQKQQANLQQRRLLIIDSNETSRQYLSLQAESWNLVVETAESAEVAITNLFRKEPPDVIAINEPLVDMESIQLASQIRNFPNYQTIPIILFQGQHIRNVNQLNILGSRIRTLQKPARRSQFYNMLVELLTEKEIVIDTKVESTTATALQTEKPLRILLTDDILLNQKVALAMLSSFGYEADVANNGKEAVEAVQKNTYDLVFMDVQMPEMDGLEATRTIRNTPDIQQPYIIAMTAHAMQGDKEECLSAGMNDYISKPIRKPELAEMLKKCPQISSNSDTPDMTNTTVKNNSAEETMPVLDTEILEGVSMEKEFLFEVCKGFLDDAPRRLVAIEAALEQEDAKAIKVAAHALKSLSSCVGAMSLFQVCKTLEAAGKNNQVEPARSLLTTVNTEYQKAHTAVGHYQQQL